MTDIPKIKSHPVLKIVGPTWNPYEIAKYPGIDNYEINKYITRDEKIEELSDISGWNNVISRLAARFAKELTNSAVLRKGLVMWNKGDLREITVPCLGAEHAKLQLNWNFYPIGTPQKDHNYATIQVSLMALIKETSLAAPVDNPGPVKIHDWFPIMKTKVPYKPNSNPEDWIYSIMSRLFIIPLAFTSLVKRKVPMSGARHHQALVWTLSDEHRLIKVFYHDIEGAYTINTETQKPKFSHMIIDHIISVTPLVKSLGQVLMTPYTEEIFDYIRLCEKSPDEEAEFKQLILQDEYVELYLKAKGFTYWFALKFNTDKLSVPQEEYELLKFNGDTDGALEIYSKLTYNLMILLTLAIFL